MLSDFLGHLKKAYNYKQKQQSEDNLFGRYQQAGILNIDNS